jgi:hypothetical protein
MRYLVSRVVRSYGAGVSTAAVIEAMVLRIRAAMWIAVRVGGGCEVVAVNVEDNGFLPLAGWKQSRLDLLVR